MSEPKKITSLYAWIATEADGGEGVPATNMVIGGREMMLPLIGADLDRIRSLRPETDFFVDRGMRLRLCRFQWADDLDER